MLREKRPPLPSIPPGFDGAILELPSFAAIAPFREIRPRKMLRAKPPRTQSEESE